MDIDYAIDRLEIEKGQSTLLDKALDMAIQALERTRWIPVSERLPELEDTNGEYDVIGYESNFKIVSTQHYADFEMNKKLTHWMPLPKPPGVE